MPYRYSFALALCIVKRANQLILRLFGLAWNLSSDLLERVPDKSVTTPAAAGEVEAAKAFAALADPAYLTGRNTGHQSIVLNVSGHHRAGTYQGAAADGMAAHYRAVRAERCAFAHARTRVNPVHREVRPRGVHVGEHAGRSAEYVVLQLYPLVYRDIVLDTDAVAYADVAAYVDVLSERAVRSDHGTLLDMAEMPYLGTGTYLDSVIDVAALVNVIVLHCSYKTSMLSRLATAFIAFLVSNTAFECCCTKS